METYELLPGSLQLKSGGKFEGTLPFIARYTVIPVNERQEQCSGCLQVYNKTDAKYCVARHHITENIKVGTLVFIPMKPELTMDGMGSLENTVGVIIETRPNPCNEFDPEFLVEFHNGQRKVMKVRQQGCTGYDSIGGIVTYYNPQTYHIEYWTGLDIYASNAKE